MEEDEIKALVGEDNYKEGLTAVEVQEIMKSKLLETGDYVNKSMAEADKKKLQLEIAETKNKLKGKLSEEELTAAEIAQQKADFEAIKLELAETKKSSNKSRAYALTAEAKLNAGLTDEDKDYAELIENIISEDKDKTEKTAKSINDLVKKAYEKGMADTVKNKMGKMGGFKAGSGEADKDDDSKSDSEIKAKELAERFTPKKPTESYFS